MASRVADIVAQCAAPVLKHLYGRSVTLKGPGQSDLAVTALWIRPARGDEMTEGARSGEMDRMIAFELSDITSAGNWNEVTIDSEDWALEHAPELEGESIVVYRAELSRQIDLQRPEYRPRR